VSTSTTIAWFFTFALAYLVAPVALVWGWIRYIKDRRQLLTVYSMLSFSGLLLASASALWGLVVILYAFAGGFGTLPEHYAPNYGLFYRCVLCGAVVSLLAILLALSGTWRKGAIRWQSLASALGTLAFWLVATTWP